MRQLHSFIVILVAAAGLLALNGPASGLQDETFEAKIAGLEHKAGLLDLYLDHQKARVLLALDAPDEDGIAGRYLYAPYLTGGLGSNPVGLDRSVPRGAQILVFRRVGNRVLAVIENTEFIASADNPAEKRAVRTSFAQSAIWSTEVLAVDDASGKLLIDLTEFLMRDAVGVAARLKDRGQGSFMLDKSLSYVDTKAAFMFPINGEFDAYLTFTSSSPGREVRTTTPDPRSATLVAHTTLRKMPEPGFVPRAYDERAALMDHSFVDMSAPLDGDTVVRLAARFRLEKDASGKVVNPIVFYIDNGAPEPIRSALKEGASWWAEAFEAAGFPGGYRVEILPEDVHPLDARYNVVNWVHRATRGWSYGASMRDPRTGEILRGVVLLGSLRVRQDIKIFEALAGAAKTGSGDPDDPVEVALARIRQLSAHEVGHALGFAHNMAASSYGGRASVMDYPAPHITLGTDGEMDFSNAYGVGMGAWDIWTTRYLYADDGGDPAGFRTAMIAEADARGLVYVSDRDSRSVGTGHAKGALWDNGEDPVTTLTDTMALRRAALDRFGANNLRPDESAFALQTKFVPLYLYHRYQLQAAAKLIGGADFAYRRKGDGRPAPVAVPWGVQERALDALLAAISPDALSVRPQVWQALSPIGVATGDPQFGRETFNPAARPMFDRMGAAAVAVELTLDALLHPARLARVHAQALDDDDFAGLEAYYARIEAALLAKSAGAENIALGQQTLGQYAERLISLSLEGEVAVSVRQASRQALLDLRDKIAKARRQAPAFADGLVARINDALARAKTPAVKPPAPPSVPPGSPIGSEAASCWHCYGDN